MKKLSCVFCFLFLLACFIHSAQALSLYDKPIQENPYYDEQANYAEAYTLEAVQYFAFSCITEIVGIQVPIAENFRYEVVEFSPTHATTRVHLPNGEYFTIGCDNPYTQPELAYAPSFQMAFDVMENLGGIFFEGRYFAGRSLEYKAAFSDKYYPIARAIEAIDPLWLRDYAVDFYAMTYYRYGLPTAKNITEESAYKLAVEHVEKHLLGYTAKVDGYYVYFDVSNEKQPLWKFRLLLAPQEGKQYPNHNVQVKVDANSAEVLFAGFWEYKEYTLLETMHWEF